MSKTSMRTDKMQWLTPKGRWLHQRRRRFPDWIMGIDHFRK
ncbi:hypothetical protein SJ05684_c24190 [Sinorhizobium sojae CCBAU 05684]|uniref:Uncharacterized protein n=1 Tax=Sinorhizobium sojae CCBAU 05684 TaxID=716928 RepID=A0A249PF29_9HYPH|nr:hypothetical protein SJ05684_c24190 [Sinorhizobium sojae CCBAU 05684]